MRLVYLVFASNGRSCEVLDEAPEGSTVDLATKRWRYKDSRHGQGQWEPIGRESYLGNGNSHLIGVYDLDDPRQVNSMVHSAIDSQVMKVHTS